MKHYLHQLWNFELNELNPIWSKFVFYSILVLGFAYVLGEVLFGLNEGAIPFTFQKCIEMLGSSNNMITPYEMFEYIFPYVWILFAGICIIVRMAIIISSYFLSQKKLGDTAFTEYMLTYFSSFLIAIGFGFGLLFVLVGIVQLMGFDTSNSINVFSDLLLYLKTTVNHHVPSILQVSNYWLAIVLTIFLSALPGYFIHWLSHKMRFFWLVTHRAHHVPQFLHPLGAPPAFVFDFLLIIPGGIVAIIISKLIYTEPLVMEIALWGTLGYCFEIFNHSLVHYDFAYNNFYVRNFSRLFGDKGVYHLVHHSAFEQDQNINFGSGPFMFWDRLFGTYRKPYKEAPPVGLTNRPEMRMNPFRIIFNGIAQLAYELKMNQNFKTRLKIIFGDVYYMPPITKDFLVLDKNK